jgi:heat shock transcription factor
VTYTFANTMASRKRRAPGASPIENTYQDTTNTVSDTFMNNFNDPSSTDMGAFGDPSFYEGLNFPGNMGQPSTHNRVVSLDGMNGNADMNSGQLVRRNPNQQLATRGQNAWGPYASPDPGGAWEAPDDDEELERKAVIAKKEAQSKRKQIPPFVQKLSRYGHSPCRMIVC